MEDLLSRKCEACRAGAPKVTEEELAQYSPLIPEWTIVEEDGVKKLTRQYRTQGYAETVSLFNGIAELANAEDHHPVMLVEYSSVTVWWWTHKINGLHLNDLIMAAKTDSIQQKLSQ